MDDHELQVYLWEVQSQCRFSLNAMGGLQNVVQRLPGAFDDEVRYRILREEVFRSVHSFLTHASNASRLLWPPKANRAKGEADEAFAARRLATRRRGEVLCGALAIDGRPHPLRDRRLRDHLEHYDERLDQWRAESKRKNIAMDTIGPANAIVGLDASDSMRWYDDARNVMRFRGEEYDLNELARSIEDLLRRTEAALTRLDRRPTRG